MVLAICAFHNINNNYGTKPFFHSECTLKQIYSMKTVYTDALFNNITLWNLLYAIPANQVLPLACHQLVSNCYYDGK